MNMVIDASSLILFAKADILRETAAIAALHTTEEVKSEVLAGAEKGRKDAWYLQELLKEGVITVDQTDKKMMERLGKDFNMGQGEASVITVALRSPMPLLTDDNKARKVGKVLGIEVLSSLDFPPLLYKKEIIPYEKAVICLEMLQKEGWFGEGVIREAFAVLERIRGERHENNSDDGEVA